MNPSDKIKTTTADSNNDGIVNSSAARGQTIIEAYGKDNSGLKGSAEAERGKSMPNTGMKKSLGK